eukprot:TRINITY_DN3408_c0_g1_i1.p1 TRINITY_DN3408_c0_g1~~TRINITY_DN3408_c0_g1_i1.p1  ORF type:complete len:126 (-),score=8.33 TRINITY_DN3408_c0_g1_i1:332-709(-)
MAEISKPACRIASIISPAVPSVMARGFIKQRVQKVKHAVVGRLWASDPKKNPVSRAALALLSLPCAAFLVPSVPKRPRIESGACSLATAVFVGPIYYKHVFVTPNHRLRSFVLISVANTRNIFQK